MIFKPFKQQAAFLRSKARIKLAASGKRGGKTEIGAIHTIINLEQRPGYIYSPVDEYIAVIIAPTMDMLRRLSFKKFMGFSKPFRPIINRSHFEVKWPNGSIVYGISADRPERLEGIKANYIWIDESLQVPEQIFTEALARVADTKGQIVLTGSLGVQYTNPKSHWVYRHFKQKPIADSEAFEWSTADNPHFPQEELERLKDTLDPQTYKQLFEISWDTQSTAMVYEQFSEANIIRGYRYNPELETSVCVDWGWTHPMSVGYFQYDPKKDIVYLFDEIFSSRMTINELWDRMKSKPYRVHNYYCDIAGNQERELAGRSNTAWFKKEANVHFKYRQSGILHGISIVRSYICNARGQRKFYIDEVTCPHSVAGLKSYRYEEKNGMIVSEMPLKKDDDAVDMMRYYFVNRHDFTRTGEQFTELNRYKIGG